MLREALKELAKDPEECRKNKSTRMLKTPVASTVESEALTKASRKWTKMKTPAEDEEDEKLKTMVQLLMLSDAREARNLRLHSTRMLKLPVVLKELAETPPSKAREVGGGWETNPELKVMVP